LAAIPIELCENLNESEDHFYPMAIEPGISVMMGCMGKVRHRLMGHAKFLTSYVESLGLTNILNPLDQMTKERVSWC
jgi:hypothetical protein